MSEFISYLYIHAFIYFLHGKYFKLEYSQILKP